MPVVSTIPVGPKGAASFSAEEKGGRERMLAVRASLVMSLLLIVWVAPSSLASEMRLGRMSTAIIVFTPRALAD